MAAQDHPESVLTLRARVAGYHRRGRAADDPDLLATRRDLAYKGLAEHIRRVAESAPPPTPEQSAELRSLLPAPAGNPNP